MKTEKKNVDINSACYQKHILFSIFNHEITSLYSKAINLLNCIKIRQSATHSNPSSISWKNGTRNGYQEPYPSLISLINFLMCLSQIDFCAFGLLKKGVIQALSYNNSWTFKSCSRGMGKIPLAIY